MLTRLKRMLVKEFLQMLRDPRMRLVVFGLPVMQMLILAFALTTDVTRVGIAVLDHDRTRSPANCSAPSRAEGISGSSIR